MRILHVMGISGLVATGLVAGCGEDASSNPQTPVSEAGVVDVVPVDAAVTDGGYDWHLPRSFPTPIVPDDNPMTKEKVTLGRRIFYDKRLSKNQTQSCASCHKQELAFTDGLAQSVGSTNVTHPRSSMSIVNVAYAPTLTWANPLMTDLERQAQIPIFSEDPVELGTTSTPDLEARFASEPLYVDLFAKAFPDDPQIKLANLLKALASFERSIISGNSPYDRYASGEQTAVSESAKRGFALFNSENFECFHCHVAPFFTDHTTYTTKPFHDRPYHNTGLYNIDGNGAYPAPNTGVHAVTGKASDMGKFKAPSLRNVALTAPYMHDGSIATLEGVLDHYMAGGRAHSGLVDPLIVPHTVSQQDRDDVIEFLKTLTDDSLLVNPELSDPWK